MTYTDIYQKLVSVKVVLEGKEFFLSVPTYPSIHPYYQTVAFRKFGADPVWYPFRHTLYSVGDRLEEEYDAYLDILDRWNAVPIRQDRVILFVRNDGVAAEILEYVVITKDGLSA